MSVPAPHFLLYSHVERQSPQGHWKFVLEAADGTAKFEASDCEPEIRGERLELLAVVRALEALDQPSRVTLFTESRYVRRGISYGLDQWRRAGWTWECFGQMVPIKNRDLWQRVDRALKYHRLESRRLRVDAGHLPSAALHTHPEAPKPVATTVQRQRSRRPLRRTSRRWWLRTRRTVALRLDAIWLSIAQSGTPWLPRPWFQ